MELYDLAEDPLEQQGGRTGLEDERGRAGELNQTLEGWLRRLPTERQCAAATLDPETQAQLRALGYLD